MDPKNKVYEIIFRGAIGTGKTTCAVLLLGYQIYLLSCLRDPHEFYGLMADSPLPVGIYTIHKYKAVKEYTTLRTMVDKSPYFQECFPRHPDKKERGRIAGTLEFASRISVITGADELHAIGENILVLMIDEANFMREGKKGTGNKEDEVGQAEALYNAARDRMVSRFMRGGIVPGLLILSSSERAKSDFVVKHCKQVRADPHVRVAQYALWEVRDQDFSGETFNVVVGDRIRQSRILKPHETPPPGVQLLQPPIEYLKLFQNDLDKAIRDIGGQPTEAISPLIPRVEVIYESINKELSHPFSKERFTLTDRDKVSIADYLVQQKLITVRNGKFVPCRDPEALRAIHIDLARSGDAAGFAMGHIKQYKIETDREEVPEVELKKLNPIIEMDMMLAILPPDEGIIPYKKIRDFIEVLNRFGFRIAVVSYDGFESAESVSILQQLGYEAQVLSVDRNDAQYMSLLSAMNEHRFLMYQYDVVVNELIELEHDIKKKKVDHPPKGSKDVADCLAGVCWHCHHTIRDQDLTSQPFNKPPITVIPDAPQSDAERFGLLDDYEE